MKEIKYSKKPIFKNTLFFNLNTNPTIMKQSKKKAELLNPAFL